MSETLSHQPSAAFTERKRERLRKIARDGKVRRQVCPKCSAKVGEDCVTSGGWEAGSFHNDRIKLAGL